MRALSLPRLLLPLRAAAAALCLAFVVPPALAVVDDAHSAALEAAMDAVKHGFKIRQEYWKGKLKAGEQKIVKHQLFKGNEVWFWLGTSTEEEVKLDVEIYDAKGNKVTLEKKSGTDFAAARVVPSKTGTYLVVFRIDGKTTEEIDWALVYGWK